MVLFFVHTFMLEFLPSLLVGLCLLVVCLILLGQLFRLCLFVWGFLFPRWCVRVSFLSVLVHRLLDYLWLFLGLGLPVTFLCLWFFYFYSN